MVEREAWSRQRKVYNEVGIGARKIKEDGREGTRIGVVWEPCQGQRREYGLVMRGGLSNWWIT